MRFSDLMNTRFWSARRVGSWRRWVSPTGAEMSQILFNQRRAIETLDRLYRDGAPMEVGQRIQLLCATVEIGEDRRGVGR